MNTFTKLRTIENYKKTTKQYESFCEDYIIIFSNVAD